MSEYLKRAFSPATLGKSLELRNRIIKAATYEAATRYQSVWADDS